MREYSKPQISVLYIGDLMQQNFPVSNRQGTGAMAKPGDDEWEEDEETPNKWDNLVPSNLPGSWQPVGE